METQEAAEKYAEPYRCPATSENEYCRHDIISAFNNGAKYQAERMYSKEDLRQAYEHGMFAIIETGHGDKFEEWFEQFKKK